MSFLLLGVAVLALGVASLFYKPIGVLFCAMSLCGVGLSFVATGKSISPSSAPRVTVEGHAVDWNREHTRRSSWWTFVLKQSPSDRLLLNTVIEVPEDVRSEVALRTEDTVRVTYLYENANPFLPNPQVVRLDVINGKFAGWTGSVDAGWFGWWIGRPGGFAIALLGLVGAQNWKRSKFVKRPILG
jgi:hypothetical protein